MKCSLINTKNFEVYLSQLKRIGFATVKNHWLILLKFYSETSRSLGIYTDMEFRFEILVTSAQ